ncbi:MAG: DUF1647 domain-containing protein [Symploca sp. SIO1B1]|nr:DUF1647 domain-containing protein [Symploca sp. SIO1C2]NER92616.1 DUF1647 domain-containing protein [Symploca sp. SIO1B1]
MFIITAANSPYFWGLENLVGSIHFWAPEQQIIIYNLGLNQDLIEEINTWKNTSIVNRFLPKNVPEHCKVIHYYAWKPLAIYHAIHHHQSLLWVDAGSDFRAPLTTLQSHLEQDGHLFVQGQDLDMTLMSHDGCYEAMGTKKAYFQGKQHFAGNLQGYVQNGKAHKLILEPLYRNALNRDCIAPPGSNLTNHRFDQTVLSILIYQSELSVVPRTNLLSAHRQELHPEPEQPSSATVYTARCSSEEYVDKILES